MIQIVTVERGNITIKKLFKAAKKLGRKIQRLLVQLLLALLYLIGFGLTKLWISVFRRGLFSSGKKESVSFWLPAKDHAFDSHDSDRQS